MSNLQFKANSRQKEALRILYDDIHTSIGYGGGGGGGKSYLACFWAWSQCNQYPGVSYFLGRETLKSLKASTLVTYYKFISEYNIPAIQAGRYNENLSKILFENGSEIPLLELKYYPSDPLVTALGSLELTGGYIEESAEVDFRVIDVLYSRIGRRYNDRYNIKAKILEGFNPAKNHVSSRFYEPWKEGKLRPGVAFIPALALDWLTYPDHFRNTHSLHPDEPQGWWTEYILNLLDRAPITRDRLLWGKFDYDDDKSALCTYDSIRDAFTNDHVMPTRSRWMTADIALQGSDSFVIGVWDGFILIDLQVIPKCDGPGVIKILSDTKIKFNVPNSQIIYDNDGIGAFVGGFLQGSKAFVNNGTAKEIAGEKENYANLKSQCYYRLAKRINSREIYLKAIADRNDHDLTKRTVQELEQIKQHDPDKDGKLKVLPKEIIKANIGRSPDISDMLMMREYGELMPQVVGLEM